MMNNNSSSSNSNNNIGGGPRAKCDQVIFEAITKAAEIIAHARSPSPYLQSVSSRFNLQVPEIAEIRHSLQHFRQSLHIPLRMDVYCNSQLVERWSLEYLQQHAQQQQQALMYGDSIVQLRHVCKKIVIWLRTLYVMTRMLPAFGVRGSNVQYRLEQGSTHSEVPAFHYSSSPSVPTPYGVLQFKVWYAPHLQQPTTKPIPIVQTSTAAISISSPSPIMAAKSAPMREVHAFSSGGHVGSLDRRSNFKKAQSNREDHSATYEDRPRLHERSHSGQLSHRAALHDPPTYAYNAAPTTNRPDVPLIRSSSPVLGSTPTNFSPALLSSTPPTLGFLLPPSSVRNSTTPPFTGLPRELSKEVLPQFGGTEPGVDSAHPVSSLDLLHSSPFKVPAFSSLGESEAWLRSSTMPSASSYIMQSHTSYHHHQQQPVMDDEDDMPFAVDVDPQEPISGGVRAHRLQLLETSGTGTTSSADHDLSTLSKQLQDFKAFGASLGA